MEKLTKYFPKEIAFPQRIIVKNKKEFYDKFNELNSNKNKLYYSLYNCDEKGNFDNCKLDKIAFDIDGGIEKAKKVTLKLVFWLIEMKYKFLIIFSTGGFWVYIFTKNYEDIKNKKEALKNAQVFICEKVGLSYKKQDDDIDFHILGDISRVARLPNSYDCNRKRYCIPISIADLILKTHYLLKKAEKQNFVFQYYGSEYFNISKFDTEKKVKYIFGENIIDSKLKNNKVEEYFLPCIKSWLIDENKCKNMTRFWFALYCQEISLPHNVTETIAKQYWDNIKESNGNKTKFEEFKQERQIDFVKNKIGMFPKCDTIIEKGFCPGKCEKYEKNTSPIYIEVR